MRAQETIQDMNHLDGCIRNLLHLIKKDLNEQ